MSLNKLKSFWAFFFIKFLKKRLKILKIQSLVLYFFLLILRVLFNFTPSYINKNFRVAKILLKKSLKLKLGQKLYLSLIFILVLTKTDLAIKKNTK